jgi:hypothetical protein
MVLFDSLRKVEGKVKNLKDLAVKKYKHAKKLEKMKIELLMRFELDELKKICELQGIPTYYYALNPLDPLSENRIELENKYELIVEMLKISLDDIIDYAERYGVEYRDVLEELEEFERLFQEKWNRNTIVLTQNRSLIRGKYRV